jgi:hypothetical protein
VAIILKISGETAVISHGKKLIRNSIKPTLKVLISLPAATTLLLFSIHDGYATSDGCAEVKKTPDGFLNLRNGPSTEFETLTKLYHRDQIWFDTAQCAHNRGVTVCYNNEKWWHVTSVRRIDAGKSTYTQGWARKDFLKVYTCPDD